jgi:hypothetical protein
MKRRFQNNTLKARLPSGDTLGKWRIAIDFSSSLYQMVYYPSSSNDIVDDGVERNLDNNFQ